MNEQAEKRRVASRSLGPKWERSAVHGSARLSTPEPGDRTAGFCSATGSRAVTAISAPPPASPPPLSLQPTIARHSPSCHQMNTQIRSSPCRTRGRDTARRTEPGAWLISDGGYRVTGGISVGSTEDRHPCGVGLVAGLTRELGLRACQPRAWKRTTVPG